MQWQAAIIRDFLWLVTKFLAFAHRGGGNTIWPDAGFAQRRTPQPETHKTQAIVADVLMTKYQRGGASEFKKK